VNGKDNGVRRLSFEWGYFSITLYTVQKKEQRWGRESKTLDQPYIPIDATWRTEGGRKENKRNMLTKLKLKRSTPVRRE